MRRLLIARHGGEDFTITTQQQMLDVLGSVLNIVTLAVAALGGISLLVGGVGIFTIMTIAVRERTFEIGLLRAVGAQRGQVRNLFMGESILLAGLGGLFGLLLGALIVESIAIFFPALPLSYSIPYAVAAEILSLVIGLVRAWRRPSGPRAWTRSKPCGPSKQHGRAPRRAGSSTRWRASPMISA